MAEYVDQGDRDAERGDGHRDDHPEPRGATVLPRGNQDRDQEGDPTPASREFENRHEYVDGAGPDRLKRRRRGPDRRQHTSRDQPGTKRAASPTRQHQ